VNELPPAYLERMAHLLGDEYKAFLASYNDSPCTGLRVNTLKLSAERFLTITPFHLEQIPWSPVGFRVIPPAVGSHSPGKHPHHAAGLFYLQEPSAIAVAELLNPRPGERVLDLAAAPGGKSTHLAAKMENQGLLVANEIHPQRAWDLAENLERCGVRNATITNETPEHLAEHFGAFFDRVLVDAPCSGEGLFRKSPKARMEWNLKLVESCSIRQSKILESAARLVRPGGWLAYATCTFSPQENEARLARFLESHPEFEIIPSPRLPGFSAGHPEWLNPPAPDSLRGAFRLWPHRAPGEGHFIALLRRDDSQANSAFKPYHPGKIPTTVQRLYQEFIQENLVSIPTETRLELIGSYLYQLPADLPDLGALRRLHPGWWLGTMKKNRFVPAHALAMGLAKEDALRLVELVSSDPGQVNAYLRGESLSGERQGKTQPDGGWVMVTVDGFPLGWGKQVQGVIKNYYPHGLRRF